MSVITQFDTCFECGTPADPLLRCSRCRIQFYCGDYCQRVSWKQHKRVCKAPPPTLLLSMPPNDLAGVQLRGGYNRPFWPFAITVPASHPVWTKGAISPISQIVGVPLLIHRDLEEQKLGDPNVAEKDNQSVTYLMISPESGFAAPRWQKNIGPVTVVRADHKPLTPVALEMMWMFCDRILERFGDNRQPPLDLYNQKAFNDFCQDYKEGYVMNGIRAEEIGAQPVPI